MIHSTNSLPTPYLDTSLSAKFLTTKEAQDLAFLIQDIQILHQSTNEELNKLKSMNQSNPSLQEKLECLLLKSKLKIEEIDRLSWLQREREKEEKYNQLIQSFTDCHISKKQKH